MTDLEFGTDLTFSTDGVYGVLAALERPCYVARAGGRIGAAARPPGAGTELLSAVGPLPPERLGTPDFARWHGVRFPYQAGAMAGGIASVDLVTALARAGYLASFGAAGLSPERIDAALRALGRELPYAANLIHAPATPRYERSVVDLYLRHGVRCVEASAFVGLTPEVVRYRVAGLRPDAAAGVRIEHRVIAKVSRTLVAEVFLRPPPPELVARLVASGEVTAEQAELARLVPMCDDLTVEADSGGHTDRRPLVCALPEIIRLRDRIAREVGYTARVRVGAAGGIGTPQAALAAFSLGAAYVVTGSVNQACVEAGTSTAAKAMLAKAGPADYAMAPAADMFELGAEVQVLKRGTLYPGRARRLYELYSRHADLDELSDGERRYLESQVLRRPVADVWQDTQEYLAEYQPDELRRSADDPKLRMALLFRWYLGSSSRWATTGEPDRVADYQLWCGPAMGAFNEWTTGTALAEPEARSAPAVAGHILRGAAFGARVAQLRFAGVRLPASCSEYRLPPADLPTPAPAPA